MENAIKIFYLLILCGVLLYFVPSIMGLAGLSGFSSAQETLGAIAISLDGGENFRAAKIHGGNVDIYDIERSRINPSFVYAGTNKGVLISKDSGNNWYPFSDLEGELSARAAVYDILVNPNSPSEVYVAATVGGKGMVYVTRDNFFTITPIFDEDTSSVRALAASNGAIYFQLSDGRVVKYSPSANNFEFDQNGNNDVFAGNNLAYYSFTSPVNSAYAAAIAPPSADATAIADNGPLVLLGSNAKLYRSTDYGVHWTIGEPVAENRSISVIRISNSDNMVIIGSKSGSLF